MTLNEKKIFEDAFRLGFSKSFDGWNGQTFQESNGILYNELLFQEALTQEFNNYEREQFEKIRAFSIPRPIDIF